MQPLEASGQATDPMMTNCRGMKVVPHRPPSRGASSLAVASLYKRGPRAVTAIIKARVTAVEVAVIRVIFIHVATTIALVIRRRQGAPILVLNDAKMHQVA